MTRPHVSRPPRAERGEPLFVTRLVAPRPPPGFVARPRLLDALDAGARGPVTLVSAPAGSGKTALLAAWVGESRPPGTLAWLSLAREDRDRRSFWTALLAALATGPRGLDVPRRGRPGIMLPALVEALAVRRAPVTLVLDDFHELGDAAAVGDVQQLIDHAPPTLRLVIASRADPPLRLQRLRVAGQLTELRTRELAFTAEETRQLGEALGLQVSGPDLETLRLRTEGWVAGLRLAALSLAGHPDPHAFVEGFAGDDRAVSDYLLSEVISRQPPETLDFLLRTSVVDRVCGPLADALMATTGGGAQLDALMRRDGLISALDAHGTWYRYHPLFLEVLRLELARVLPGDLATLHRRAARWYQAEQQPFEAVRHATLAADWDLAADVMGEHWLGLVIRGQGARLREAIAGVPPDVVRAHAELALASAGLLFDAGDGESADELLGLAEALGPDLPLRRRRRLAIGAATTRLYRERLRGDVEAALRDARRVLEEHWDRSISQDVRALALTTVGGAELWADDTASARRHLQEASGLARRCDNDYVLFAAEAWAAAAALRDEHLDEARRRATGALELADSHGWSSGPAAGVAYYTLAALALLAADLPAARTMLDRAKAAIDLSGERLLAAALAQVEVALLAADGEPLAALDVLRASSGGEDLCVPRFLRMSGALLEAELLQSLGEPARARRVLIEADAVEDVSDAGVGFARWSLAAGAPEDAIAAVAAFVADERAPTGHAVRVEAWVLDAIARDEIRDEDAALGALERALDIAEPRGLLRPLVRYGAPVRSLLRRRIRAGTAHRALAGELLALLEEDGARTRDHAAPLLEPLSDRELAVLRFLPTMMSNTEIAAEMFVSVNTVKTHLKHIYRKLDVTDRRDAVRRGRELHLLNPGLRER
jgi:LuxR family maltose regulon positive regulatory protein